MEPLTQMFACISYYQELMSGSAAHKLLLLHEEVRPQQNNFEVDTGPAASRARAGSRCAHVSGT